MKAWILRSLIVGGGIGLALAAGMTWYGLQRTLPAGMTVSGWSVGGLEAGQFESRLEEQLERVREKSVAMTASLPKGGGTATRSAKLGELGLVTNASALAAEVERLFDGAPWQRALLRWQWRGRALTLEAGLDAKALAETTKKVWPELYATWPVDARRTILAGDRVAYTPEVPATRPDEAKLHAAALAALGGGGAPVGGLVPLPEALRADGRLLSEGPLAVAVPVVKVQPKVTVASLKAQGIERLISSFSTSFASSKAGRKYNVSKTAAVVHDRLMAPGDVFDYATIIKETEEKFGFREAPVILNGKMVPGIGGGICQVSTTLYNAVLRAGLEIVERRNHSLPVSYAPLGQDATFAEGYINFKFRNSTDKYILIRTSSEGGRLTVKLFGSLDAGVSYEIKSVTLREIDPPTKYVKNASLPKGTVKLLQRGKPGYVVETYRYKKVNGRVVDKERISKDTYKAQPSLYASNAGGTGDDHKHDARDEMIVEDGVLAPVFDAPAEEI
ncbi:MAG TPA: VanW family protein [Paenibacillus sp.]|nr:VanW family protein [Paenibacillus sp.]